MDWPMEMAPDKVIDLLLCYWMPVLELVKGSKLLNIKSIWRDDVYRKKIKQNTVKLNRQFHIKQHQIFVITVFEIILDEHNESSLSGCTF